MNVWLSIKRFLRKPVLVLGEISAMAVAGVLGALFPGQHIFQSAGFAVVTLFAAASLAVVVLEQFRRATLPWRQPPSPAQFESAPFKIEFERAATAVEQASCLPIEPMSVRMTSPPLELEAGKMPAPLSKTWSERRFGAAGSLVFHLGLLALILAGAWRALFVQAAVVDLLEGETLAPGTQWSAQWPGVFGKPLRLDQPITLESIGGRRYADGDLRELRAKFSAGEMAVNRQLEFGGGQLYLAQEFGPAALLEWNSSRRDAVLLNDIGGGNYCAEAAGPGGLKILVRGNAGRASSFEMRIMRGPALLAAGTVAIGQSLALPDGASVALRGAPMWARLHASRDSALWLAYAGMVLTMAGAALMFCWIKLDFCIVVTPLGGREKVFLALKPQRFAPLFQERFEEFVREQTSDRSGVSAERRHLIVSETAALCRGAATLLMLACLAFASGCDRVSSAQARQLVERYNQVVSEAYRRGDVRLIDPVVGPNEGRKLTGLIGVRSDMGITLDSQLLSLDVVGVERTGNALRVRTKEKWSYRDLKIGSGEQVGEASVDFYEMTYLFTNVNRMWLVDEISFAAPPQVGRINTPWIADRREMHGVTTQEARP